MTKIEEFIDMLIAEDEIPASNGEKLAEKNKLIGELNNLLNTIDRAEEVFDKECSLIANDLGVNSPIYLSVVNKWFVASSIKTVAEHLKGGAR